MGACVLTILLSNPPNAHPQSTKLPFQGLSSQELAILESGEPLIRKTVSAKFLSLAVLGEFPDEIRSRIRRLRANYVGEVLMSLPADRAPPTIFADLARDLSNVEGYVGIPYWSNQNKRYYDLFDRMNVLSRNREPTGESIFADQHMEPFEEYRARYSYTLGSGELRFASENITPIIYRSFKAVFPGNMVWYLYGFKRDHTVYLYGVGAVRAFDMFGLFGERLRTSFMGRIEAFFSYLYSRRARENSGDRAADAHSQELSARER